MKAGDIVNIRRPGQLVWGQGKLVLVSANKRSIFVAGEDLPVNPEGITIHPEFGRCMALLQQGEYYEELFTGAVFEVQP